MTVYIMNNEIFGSFVNRFQINLVNIYYVYFGLKFWIWNLGRNFQVQNHSPCKDYEQINLVNSHNDWVNVILVSTVR